MKKLFKTLLVLLSIAGLTGCGTLVPDKPNGDDSNKPNPNPPIVDKDPMDRVDVSKEKTWIVDGKDTYVQYAVEQGKEKPFDRYKRNYWYVENEAHWICDYVDGKLKHPIIHYVVVKAKDQEDVKLDIEHGKLITGYPTLDVDEYSKLVFKIDNNEIDINTLKVYKDLKVWITKEFVESKVEYVDLKKLSEYNYQLRKNANYPCPYLNRIISTQGTFIGCDSGYFNRFIANVENGQVKGTFKIYYHNLPFNRNDYVKVVGKLIYSNKYGLELIDLRDELCKVLLQEPLNKDYKLPDNRVTAKQLDTFYGKDLSSVYDKEYMDIRLSETVTITKINDAVNSNYKDFEVKTSDGTLIRNYVISFHVNTVNNSKLKVGTKLSNIYGTIYFEWDGIHSHYIGVDTYDYIN